MSKLSNVENCEDFSSCSRFQRKKFNCLWKWLEQMYKILVYYWVGNVGLNLIPWMLLHYAYHGFPAWGVFEYKCSMVDYSIPIQHIPSEDYWFGFFILTLIEIELLTLITNWWHKFQVWRNTFKVIYCCCFFVCFCVICICVCVKSSVFGFFVATF